VSGRCRCRCGSKWLSMRATRRLAMTEGRRVPPARAKLIEDKANGSAVIQILSNEIPGILPVNSAGGKIARAAPVSPLIEAGNVYLPHPAWAPWVNDFIEECAAFRNGARDDQVDAMTQALLR
jgi:predicted phage terminase large subunit-like protein